MDSNDVAPTKAPEKSSRRSVRKPTARVARLLRLQLATLESLMAEHGISLTDEDLARIEAEWPALDVSGISDRLPRQTGP